MVMVSNPNMPSPQQVELEVKVEFRVGGVFKVKMKLLLGCPAGT